MTDAAEFWNERAAVMEFDGGKDRHDAEVSALAETAERYGWVAVVELGKLGE